jgi:hypothetical protein
LQHGRGLAIGWFRDIATMASLVWRQESSGGLFISPPANSLSSEIH